MGDLLLKLFGSQVYAVGFCQGQAVVFYVVAYGAFDLLDVMAASGNHADHIYPERVLHAAAYECAVVFLGQHVQFVGPRRICGPAVGGFLAGGDYADAPA